MGARNSPLWILVLGAAAAQATRVVTPARGSHVVRLDETAPRFEILDVMSGHKVTVKRALPAGDPAFSPAGDELAYVFDGTLYLLDLDSGRAFTVTSRFPAGAMTSPAFSPSGRQIVWREGRTFVRAFLEKTEAGRRRPFDIAAWARAPDDVTRWSWAGESDEDGLDFETGGPKYWQLADQGVDRPCLRRVAEPKKRQSLVAPFSPTNAPCEP